MRGQFVVWWLMGGFLGMKRPGQTRGACLRARSRGQCFGLQLLIRHGGGVLRRFGIRICGPILCSLLRTFGAEDGGHPAGALGQREEWRGPDDESPSAWGSGFQLA